MRRLNQFDAQSSAGRLQADYDMDDMAGVLRKMDGLAERKKNQASWQELFSSELSDASKVFHMHQ